MSITKEKKHELIEKFQINKEDTGSAFVQVAVLTTRILNLTEHMKQNKKDFHSRRGLLIMVGKRRRLLDYIKSTNHAGYLELIASLGLRK